MFIYLLFCAADLPASNATGLCKLIHFSRNELKLVSDLSTRSFVLE